MKQESSFEVMRKKNMESVFRAVVEHRPVSRVEISELTGLNKMTVSNCVRSMLEDRILTECEPAQMAAGRPRILLDLNPSFGLIMGIEINVISCKVQVMQFNGNILRQEVVSDKAEDPEAFLKLLISLTQECEKEIQKYTHGLLGIGIALPGNYNDESGRVEFISNMKEWNGFPIRDRLQALLVGMPFQIQNAARAEAVGEMEFGGQHSSEDIVYIYGAMGLALSMYSRGGIHVGHRGFNGRFGHNIIVAGGRLCTCGCRGCLEMYASVHSVCEALYPERRVDDALLKEIIDRRQKGDPEVTEVLDECVHYLAIGLANTINNFNPAKVCIGNYLALLLKDREAALNEEVREYLLPHYREDQKIIFSGLSIWGAALGAAATVRSWYFEQWLDGNS